MRVDPTRQFEEFRGIRLLSRERLIQTGPIDHGSWTYRGVLGAIIRTRFQLVKGLMEGAHFGRLLEIGYGSGIFAPELERHCDEYFGVDIHDKTAEVSQVLQQLRVESHLTQGSVTDLPYDDDTFDCIVALSVLEFVEDKRAACLEIRRVLKPGGRFLLVVPRKSALLDFGLKLLTGESAKQDFGAGREELTSALGHYFVDLHSPHAVPPPPHRISGKTAATERVIDAPQVTSATNISIRSHGNYLYHAFQLTKPPAPLNSVAS